MSHFAIVRSSARMAQQQQRANESQQQQHDSDANNLTSPGTGYISGSTNIENSIGELSQLSVISISSSDGGGDLTHEMSTRCPSKLSTTSTNSPSTSSKTPVPALKPLMASLDPLNTTSDIDQYMVSAYADPELCQYNVLEKLEQKWLEISSNFETVLGYLQECSYQVTEASTNCLHSLFDSVETTCDEADAEIEALHELMRKCDDLTTKLSVATTFRDEIKTLRKSVETLEQLYKSKPQPKPPAKQ